MTTIPVVWYSLYTTTDHPAGHRIEPRRYWDAAWLEAIFDHSLWQPPGAYEFVHHVPLHSPKSFAHRGFTINGEEVVLDGAVVFIPARWHADDIDRINEDLSHLSWCLVVLCGDEEGVFPHDKLSHPNMAVWVQTPHPTIHSDIPSHRRVGDMFPPHCRQHVTELGVGYPRTLNWFFAGQENHRRRSELVWTLQRRLNRGVIDGELLSTRVFGSGMAYPDYMRMLASSKVAPCPSGLFTPDCFRVFEALEAGCVPIVDAVAPNNANDQGYWEFLFGEDPPFPVVHQWRNAGNMIDLLSGGEWLPTSNRIQAWWGRYKRKVAHSFHDDIQTLSKSRAYSTVADRLSVILVTSPTVTNPDTSHIEETVASIRRHPDLLHAEILLCIDGVREEQSRLQADYDEYIRRLLWMTHHNPSWFNICPLLFPTHQHQANMTRAALQEVRTPTILFMEHDTPLVGDIPWSNLVTATESRAAHMIRLHHEASILEPHRHLMLDRRPQDLCGVPALRTAQWSQRPHVANSNFYRAILQRYFSPSSRTMIEDVMHGVVAVHHHKFGEVGWKPFNVWMYAPDGDMKRSTHLDTRGNEPKYEMKIEYPKGTPFGAPRATSELAEMMEEFARQGREWV